MLSPEEKKENAKASLRKYYLKNREAKIAKSKEYNNANREKIKLHAKVYARQNYEKQCEYRRQYYIDHKAAILLWHRNNRLN